MLLQELTKTWEYHFVGTHITYIYNHQENVLGVFSEKHSKMIRKFPMKFKNVEEFQNECKTLLLKNISAMQN